MSSTQRLVLFFAGYEPLKPDIHHHRYAREIRRFDATWSAQSQVGPMRMADDGSRAEWQVQISGPNWHSAADIHLMRWDDVIDLDNGRPLLKRLAIYLAAMAGFFAHGVVWRYGRAHWRYLLFTLYPLAMLALFAAVAAIAVVALPLPPWGRWLLGCLIFMVLLRFVGRRWHMDYMFNDWAFARDFVYRSRPLMEERLARFADHIIATARAGRHAEILLVGHSLGAAVAIEALARALNKSPDLLAAAPPMALVGLGSSVLKIALHPQAMAMRQSIARLADEPLPWVDFDSHLDFISFYKADIGAELALPLRHPPQRRPIRLSRMLRPETWKRFKLNFLRLHRQYVMGNEQRYFFDFHMLTGGPLPFKDLLAPDAAWPGRFAADGRLKDAGP